MRYAAADGPLDGLAGEESIDEAGGEAVAATDSVEDIDFDLGHVHDLTLIKRNGSPVVAACGARCAKSACDEFEIWIRGGHFAEHLFVGGDGEFRKILRYPFEFDPKHRREVLLITEKEIDFADKGAIDFLGFGFAPDGAPEGIAVIEVVRDWSAVGARDVHRFRGHIGSGGGERGEDSASVEPARPVCVAQDFGPVEVAGFHLADRGVAAVVATCGGSEAESALGEVEAVADGATYTVEGNPAQERRVDSTLEDAVFHQAADGVVGERRGDGRAQAEAAAKAAGDIVFTTAFPQGEVTCTVDAAFAWVEAQHDFAEADAVPTAIRFGKQEGFHSVQSIH